jgi:S-adenosylmethionine synthetase
VVDIPNIARQIINQVGYQGTDFNARNCTIMTGSSDLPPSRYRFFDERQLSEEEIEAIPVKNQVTVFGFACNQTAAFMPLPIWLAHKLARRLASVRLQRQLPYLAPDGKTQVGVDFRDGRPQRIHAITLVATQSVEGRPGLDRLRSDLMEAVVEPVFVDEDIRPDPNTRIFINPDGPFVIGGPYTHSGLTGRKTAIDTYGEYARHSGAALSGKDPLRIDRVAAYAARYAAKNVIAAGLAEQCELQLSYSIGLPRPVSIQVETFGSGRIPDPEIARRVAALFDFRLAGILRHFNLRHLPTVFKGGFYRRLAAYGQMGRMDMGLPWENTDKAPLLRDMD